MERLLMTVNFDLLVSGCNTRCVHCYVNGGPGGIMPLQDALLYIEKLDALSELLPFECTFTLDNEPMNHPDLAAIIQRASAAKHVTYYHHGMTSGIALMRRQDRHAVIQTYLDCGFGEFGITIHGNVSHHDRIVRRNGAYQTAVEAAAFMESCGAKVGVSLMFNRYFAEDAEGISCLLDKLNPGYIYFAVPNFTPHANMMKYEPFRGTLDTWKTLLPELAAWRQKEEVSEKYFTAGMLIRQLQDGLDVKELFRQPQDELYLTVHQSGNLYAGNTGVETEFLGNLRALDLKRTAEQICSLPGNRDYGAFYREDQLPGKTELLLALSRLPQDLLYDCRESVLYRGLMELKIPTKLIRGISED